MDSSVSHNQANYDDSGRFSIDVLYKVVWIVLNEREMNKKLKQILYI